MQIFRLALREIRNNFRFSINYSLTLAFGLFGLIAIGLFKSSIDESLTSRSKEMLTADLSVSSRQEISDEKLKEVDVIINSALVEKGERKTLYSMVAKSESSKLVEVNVIDKTFPMYGEMVLREKGSLSDLFEKPRAFIYPELGIQLGLKIGDKIKIGQGSFEVANIIEEDAGASWAGVGLAPRIYIADSFLESTGLVQKGSTMWRTHLYKFQPFVDSTVLSKKIEEKLAEPSIRVRSHTAASRNQSSILNYLNDYLGLTALVAFFLAAVGIIFLYRSFISSHESQYAILMSLGMKPWSVFLLGVTQIFLLGMLASFLSVAFGIFVVPTLLWIANDLLPFDFRWHLPMESLVSSLALGGIGSIFICLPLIRDIPNIKPALLFTGERRTSGTSKLTTFIYCLPAMIFFWLLGVYQANSWIIGNLFSAGFAASTIILSVVCLIGLGVLVIFIDKSTIKVKLALRSLVKNKVYSLFCFLAISLTAFLVCTIPLLQSGLLNELESPDNRTPPSLFLFDIQEDQIQALESTLKTNDTALELISPMIRARLTYVNDKEFLPEQEAANTREAERAKRTRNRGYNLTYRDGLDWSETIVEGETFAGTYDQSSNTPPLVSLEVGFAERMNIKLGDILTFDIGGVNVKGKVANLRRVKWTSFSPNFFIQFQPGVLEPAPKTFVASVEALSTEQKSELQNAIVQSLPNVSIVDVSRLIAKIAELVEKMAFALKVMVFLTALSGLLVLFAIVKESANRRRFDIALLKTVGSSFSLIRGMFLTEFLVLSAGATIFGTSLSVASSYVVSKFIFQGIWTFDWQIPLVTVIVFVTVSLAVVSYALRTALSARAVELLGDS